MSKKAAVLSSSLVAVKGQAAASPDATGRQHDPVPPPASAGNTPLNFRVSADFRRRFRQRAAAADLKLNQLLREALDAWEEKRGLV